MDRHAADGHEIIHADVIEAFSQLEEKSVDLIFADPPYNIGKNFDGLKDSVNEEAYLTWCYRWIEECRRVLKPAGTFYLMCSTQNLAHLDLHCRTLFAVLSRIVWSYDSSGVQARKYFGSMWEPILHMVNNPSNYTFNAEAIEVEARTGAVRKLIDYRKTPPQPYNTKKVPGNVWSMPRVRFKMDEYENHPSQKPEALLERIVLASSNPGDLVLDPFGGTFSTGAVCRRLGRRSTSFEVNEAYVKIGLRRLQIESHYPVEQLTKVKVRKTKNRSKRDHEKDTQPSLI